MLTYRSREGFTQEVNETETVRIGILEQLGWRLVEPVAAEPVDADPGDDGDDQPTGPVDRRPTTDDEGDELPEQPDGFDLPQFVGFDQPVEAAPEPEPETKPKRKR